MWRQRFLKVAKYPIDIEEVVKLALKDIPKCTRAEALLHLRGANDDPVAWDIRRFYYAETAANEQDAFVRAVAKLVVWPVDHVRAKLKGTA
jgi:hypothetical protein